MTTEQNNKKIAPELKAKYFALYLGQNCRRVNNDTVNSMFPPDKITGRVVEVIEDGKYPDAYLELRPIESLTDEEKQNLLKIERLEYSVSKVNKISSPRIWIEEGEMVFIHSDPISNGGIDYLRSIGVALPLFDQSTLSIITIDELVKQNVIKLTK